MRQELAMQLNLQVMSELMALEMFRSPAALLALYYS
jgi:hypothetical protein